jgi:hypothetical protein
LRKIADDTAPRLQPNSVAMGFTITPMVTRPPVFTNRMTNEAARTYQP